MYEPDKLFTKEKLPEFSPAVVVEPWRKALLDAAEYIRVHGHCKGEFQNYAGEACAVGAIILANPGSEMMTAVRRNLAFDTFAAFLQQPIAAWNDTPERTAAEVIAALEAAARS